MKYLIGFICLSHGSLQALSTLLKYQRPPYGLSQSQNLQNLPTTLKEKVWHFLQNSSLIDTDQIMRNGLVGLLLATLLELVARLTLCLYYARGGQDSPATFGTNSEFILATIPPSNKEYTNLSTQICIEESFSG